MILVDANVLIYAIDRDAPGHAAARRWLEAALSGTEPVGFTWIVLLAFLRLVTRETVMRKPLSVDRATAYVDEWLDLPPARLVLPTAAHWGVLRSFLAGAGTAGNLTTDAHLAAMAVEHNAAVCSADHDFRRFAGVRLIQPIPA